MFKLNWKSEIIIASEPLEGENGVTLEMFFIVKDALKIKKQLAKECSIFRRRINSISEMREWLENHEVKFSSGINTF